MGMSGDPRPRQGGPRCVAELVANRGGLLARPLFRDEERHLPLVETSGLGPGDIVVVEERAGSGRVVGGRLARGGSARARLYRLAVAHRLDPLHPPAVLREARALRSSRGVEDPSLVDLVGLPFVTIDNRDSRDLDQALHVERARGGGYLVRYALADASYYLRPGSALLEEALARGASYYLPGLCIPMLPRLLCEHLVSLNQHEARRALLFEMRLGGDGTCRTTRLVRARVCSARKLSYPAVQRYYEDPGGSGFRGQPWQETLDLLAEVGRLRLEQARRRHVVSYRRAEVAVRLGGGDSAGFSVVSDRRLEVELYNEQVSLLCNAEGARQLAAARGLEHVQPVFRVHPAPSPQALAGLERLTAGMVERHQLDPATWSWRRDVEPLGGYLERLPRHGRYGRLCLAVERQACLLNDPSRFDAEPAPHHGVGASSYARFSSPMREVVGVFTHKEALEMLGRPEAALPTTADLALRERVIEAGNRAREVQRRITREANGMALDLLLGADLAQGEGRRPRRRGTVLGLEPHRFHVMLDDPTVDLKVEVADLARRSGCGFSLEPSGAALVADDPRVSALRLGDAVTLVVAGCDPPRGRWRFSVVA